VSGMNKAQLYEFLLSKLDEMSFSKLSLSNEIVAQQWADELWPLIADEIDEARSEEWGQ